MNISLRESFLLLSLSLLFFSFFSSLHYYYSAEELPSPSLFKEELSRPSLELVYECHGSAECLKSSSTPPVRSTMANLVVLPDLPSYTGAQALSAHKSISKS
ncbi:hypothetical protein CIRG_09867 [Coccidioides immitis RMSCC 2394]|uniref:Uncharacterized protein n=1 Tax=Coccidioides immitis RMSCC 2394 TaxID=404692 RepID=A0A0J6YNE3_COCIT|nr:hypothetical protein CIRG_09867 [Coccidioides immitis RMSCC 2394]